jgi:hypothetical protein
MKFMGTSDDWKNFNTVQINLKDGHQTKQSKATP